MRLILALAALFGLLWPVAAGAACPSYMVLTCRDQAANERKVVAEPSPGWTNRQVRIFDKDGDLRWKGRVETYEPTGRVRVYDKTGDLIENFRLQIED